MPELSDSHALIERVSELMRHHDLSRARATLKDMHAADIADLIEALPIQQHDALWPLVPIASKGEVLHRLPEEIRKDFIGLTGKDELLEAIKRLDTDELVDLMPDLPASTVESLMGSMAQRERQLAERLLAYSEDQAGSITNTDVLFIVESASLQSALDYMRIKKKMPKHTDKIIVSDDNNQYTGVLPLSVLVCNPPNARVRDVMDRTFPVIKANAAVHEVAKLFEHQDLISAPVINEDGQLLGRITVDDVVDIIRSQAQHTEYAASGLPIDEGLFSPIASSVKRRGLWLGVNLATAFLASWVISLFQESLEQLIVLAVLIPVVASMGGIAGGQSLTLIIRGLATEQVGRGNSRPLLLKELSISVINGVAWGTMVAIGAFLWFGHFGLGLIIAAALLINFIVAALSGVLTPIALRKIGIDPAIAGGVILTTITDVVGILAFLGLASWLLL